MNGCDVLHAIASKKWQTYRQKIHVKEANPSGKPISK
jgi:hypothetical protein